MDGCAESTSFKPGRTGQAARRTPPVDRSSWTKQIGSPGGTEAWRIIQASAPAAVTVNVGEWQKVPFFRR